MFSLSTFAYKNKYEKKAICEIQLIIYSSLFLNSYFRSYLIVHIFYFTSLKKLCKFIILVFSLTSSLQSMNIN